MKLFKQVKLLKAYLSAQKKEGKSVGFVPTMGALHNGHQALIQRSNAENELTVVSIFVNPTQFNEKEDLVNYPRPLENDIAKLIEINCDILFLPEVEEVYPDGTEAKVEFGLHKFNSAMEGTSRPGHFNGVAQVVKRLLEIVEPDTIYMGQKDFQQSRIIQKLVTDFSIPAKVEVCETVREADGLALSSRNVRLNEEERIAASLIPKVLFKAGEMIKEKSFATNDWSLTTIIKESTRKLNEHPLISVEYFEVVNATTLEMIEGWNGTEKLAICLAVRIGPIRLIDNIII